MFLVAIPLVIIVLYLATAGAALVSSMTAKAHTSFWGTVIFLAAAPLIYTAKAATLLAKYLAHELYPAYNSSAKHVAGWLSAVGQGIDWATGGDLRTKVALAQATFWARHKLAAQITKTATAKATDAAVIRTGKLTPLGAKFRYQAKAIEAAIIKSLEGDILKRIAHDKAFQSAIAADLPLARPLPGVKGGYTKAQLDVKIKEYVKAALAAAGLAIPVPYPGKPFALPRSQQRINSKTNKRLGRLEKLLGITGLAALVTATFGREITRFLRCPNTRGIAKAWCGADLAGLLGLLGVATAISGNFSIVTLAEEMLAIETQMVKVIGGAFSELDGLV